LYTYDPFGRTTVGGTSNNSFQFAGRENDRTGLYYYRARYYDPKVGRFISEDPTGLIGGINFYAYVFDNPAGFRDPSGLLVVGTYDKATGKLTISDRDTGESVTISAE